MSHSLETRLKQVLLISAILDAQAKPCARRLPWQRGREREEQESVVQGALRERLRHDQVGVERGLRSRLPRPAQRNEAAVCPEED